MSAKMGRPTDNPKNKEIKIRIDESTLEHLEELSEVQKITRASVIRKGIEIQYEQLKK